jgi:hypothetical protein
MFRSFQDKDKRIAWVYDEKTHPQGLEYSKPVVAPKIENLPAKAKEQPIQKSKKK